MFFLNIFCLLLVEPMNMESAGWLHKYLKEQKIDAHELSLLIKIKLEFWVCSSVVEHVLSMQDSTPNTKRKKKKPDLWVSDLWITLNKIHKDQTYEKINQMAFLVFFIF